MALFVLVHGMFHGGWCWERIRAPLERVGHTGVAPDLAGCGDDRTPSTDVSLDVWAASIATIANEAPEKVILVGHGRGGVVVSQAAEMASDKVAAIVYLAALLLPDGKAATDLAEIMEAQGYEVGSMIVPRISDDGQYVLPPEGGMRLSYGRCKSYIRRWAFENMGREPIAPMVTPISVTSQNWGRLPKIYIEATKDRLLTIDAQRAMIAAVRPDEVITMDTDHMSLITDVPELTVVLDGIAGRYVA